MARGIAEVYISLVILFCWSGPPAQVTPTMALVLPPLTGPMVSQPAHSYPVTESIHTLIQHISSEVSSLRRNMHTMCKLVEVARGLHDRINQSIHEVDQTGDWGVYDTYTQAIDPLEE